MAVKRTLGKLLLALVAATWLPPQATLAGWHGHRKPVSEHRDLDIARWLVQSKDFLVNLCSGLGSVATTFQAQTLCFQLSGRPLPLATSKVPQPPGKRDLPLSARKVTLSGGTACLERPPAKLRACGLPGDDQGLPKDFMVNLFAATGTVAAAVVAFVQAGIAQRDSERAQRDSERAQREAERAQRDSERAQREAERAQRESKEGRTQAAADRMMEPFTPQKKKAEVAERSITDDIRHRILHWNQHATIIAGRFGSGKTVALEEALRGRQGVYVHAVKDKDWEKSLYKDLGLDNLGMLKDALRLVKERNGGSTPILVLDIPRSTKEGMGSVSTFAKLLSSDSSLAHVIVCASSAAMAIAFDAGGDQRQKNYWVEDLSDDEAKEFLALRGHREDWEQFVQACGYRALDLHLTCGDYEGPATLAAKKEEMKEKARDEVLLFLDECEMKTLDGVTRAGANILNALVQDRRAGGTGVGALTGGKGAKPRDVAKWIRDNSAHAVIWHMPDRKYRFASELHAEAAANILKQSQSSA